MKAAYPLHILMTADAVGGVWQYALTLASELANCGHRITLAVLGIVVVLVVGSLWRRHALRKAKHAAKAA